MVVSMLLWYENEQIKKNYNLSDTSKSILHYYRPSNCIILNTKAKVESSAQFVSCTNYTSHATVNQQCMHQCVRACFYIHPTHVRNCSAIRSHLYLSRCEAVGGADSRPAETESRRVNQRLGCISV